MKRMEKAMKKIIPIAALVLSMGATGANAQIVITENNMDVSTGILTVEGVADAQNTMVTINIPKAGVAPEDLQESDNPEDYIVYSGQAKTGSNGAFTFYVDFNGEDEEVYRVYVGGNAEAEAESITTSFLSYENYGNLIGLLNEAAQTDEDEFYGIFDANEEMLFSGACVEAENDDVLKKILYNFAKDTGFSAEDSVFNMSVYKTALSAQLIADGMVSEAQTLLDSIYVTEAGIMDTYQAIDDCNTYINTDAKREYFASKFGNCDTLEDFDKEFTDAMILTVVRYPDNVTNLQTVFEKYDEYLDVDTEKATLKNYSSISGKTYDSVDACVKAFNKTAGGNGGGGGGSDRPSDDDTEFGVVTPGATDIAAEKLEIKFEDLNSVPWAYSAVSELYERNIISGRSETRFAPNDKITREEFAKLLVEMAGIKADADSNIFSDVEDGAWYAGYVNTAYNNGFCNGIGNGKFGTGREITRQDMCVMAYNVVKALGHDIPAGELAFGDVSSFAEYAKAPVAALNGAGIVNGVGNNNFNPTGNATRAEAAVVIYKVLMYIR